MAKILKAMSRPIEILAKMLEAMSRPIEVLVKMLEAMSRPIKVMDCACHCCRRLLLIVYSISILCFVRLSSKDRPVELQEALRPDENTKITMSCASVESMLEKEAIR